MSMHKVSGSCQKFQKHLLLQRLRQASSFERRILSVRGATWQSVSADDCAPGIRWLRWSRWYAEALLVALARCMVRSADALCLR